MPSASTEPILRALTEIMTRGESPASVLRYLADDCTWSLEPGGTTYRGIDEISAFISVAVSMAASRDPKKAGVTITKSFADDDGFCLEYFHDFSFSIPLVGWLGQSKPLVMKHCNTYEVRDGKIASVHEYAGSSSWWLNLLAQLALGRVYARTMKRLGSSRPPTSPMGR